MKRSITLASLSAVLDRGRAAAETCLSAADNDFQLQSSWVAPNAGSNIAPAASGQGDAAGLLIHGDNLPVMRALLHGKGPDSLRGGIDLIYIDPPFASGVQFERRIVLPGATPDAEPAILDQIAYNDQWRDGIESYLEMLYPRLALMRELLSANGSMYVHVDYRVSHWARVLLDDVFGEDNFINEIVWNKGFRGTRSNGIFQHAHDTLFWYARDRRGGYIWNQVHESYKDADLSRYNKTDEQGRRYALIKRRRTDGTVYYGKTYPDGRGKRRNDVISDIPTMASTDAQRTGYDTQKPRALLTELIAAASNPDSLVADFFCGSGTTGEAAEALGRRWLLCDAGRPAAALATRRLLALPGCRPFQELAAREKSPQPEGELIAEIEHGDLGDDTVELRIRLASYKPPAPDKLGLTKKSVRDLQETVREDSLRLLDRIELDPEYDGKTFVSRWQSLRPFTTAHAAPARLAAEYTLQFPASVLGATLALRAHDAFGFQSTILVPIRAQAPTGQ